MTASEDVSPLFCDRCFRELEPGRGSFYVIRIEAFADPTPPVFEEQDLRRDIRRELRELVEQLEDLSAQESMDQVHRRVTIYLCGPCYRLWIENPAS